jgi:hypothetical protein
MSTTTTTAPMAVTKDRWVLPAPSWGRCWDEEEEEEVEAEGKGEGEGGT